MKTQATCYTSSTAGQPKYHELAQMVIFFPYQRYGDTLCVGEL